MDNKVFKVYRHGSSRMTAATEHAEDAAALVGMSGGVVKAYGRIVFRQGHEVGNELDEVDAADSWDEAAAVMYRRVRAHRDEHRTRQGAR